MPVEWTRLSGETIEELVAVLLCREFPKSMLIRSSQGDGGIDVLVPTDGGHDVFQVKKFASNLSAAQKGQIAESLNRLEQTRVDNGVAVRTWNLTLPLDPTNQNRTWFSQLTSKVEYPCEWRGRIFVDGLAAKYPDVVDYYLHDGADRLATVVTKLTEAMEFQPKAEGAGVVTPGQLGDYLASLAGLLNSDPHFRYEVSVGPYRDSIEDEPGLILAVSEGMPGPDGYSVTVKVFPRFAAALDFRPIPIAVTLKAEPGSKLAEQIESFVKYGTPLAAPFGSVDGTFDLPGDLGGAFEGGAIRVGPSTSRQGHVIRLAAIDPTGAVAASLVIDMQPTMAGIDGTGVSVRGTDRGETIDFQFLSDLKAQTMNIRVTTRDITGRRPADILPGLLFLRSLHAPNGLAIAHELGPIAGEPMDLASLSDWLDDDVLESQIRVVEALAELQEWTTEQLLIPTAGSIDSDAYWWWATAVRLFKGEIVEIDHFSANFCLRRGVDPPEGKFALASAMEVSVRVGSQEVEVGQVVIHSPLAEVVNGSVHEHGDHFDAAIQTSDGVKASIRAARAEGQSTSNG